MDPITNVWFFYIILIYILIVSFGISGMNYGLIASLALWNVAGYNYVKTSL
jgi:hypothetical protein